MSKYNAEGIKPDTKEQTNLCEILVHATLIYGDKNQNRSAFGRKEPIVSRYIGYGYE